MKKMIRNVLYNELFDLHVDFNKKVVSLLLVIKQITHQLVE